MKIENVEEIQSYILSLDVPLEFSLEIEKNQVIDTTQNANGDSQTSTDRSDPRFLLAQSKIHATKFPRSPRDDPVRVSASRGYSSLLCRSDECIV